MPCPVHLHPSFAKQTRQKAQGSGETAGRTERSPGVRQCSSHKPLSECWNVLLESPSEPAAHSSKELSWWAKSCAWRIELNVWEQPEVTGCHSCRREDHAKGHYQRWRARHGSLSQRLVQRSVKTTAALWGGTQRISGPKSPVSCATLPSRFTSLRLSLLISPLRERQKITGVRTAGFRISQLCSWVFHILHRLGQLLQLLCACLHTCKMKVKAPMKLSSRGH